MSRGQRAEHEKIMRIALTLSRSQAGSRQAASRVAASAALPAYLVYPHAESQCSASILLPRLATSPYWGAQQQHSVVIANDQQDPSHHTSDGDVARMELQQPASKVYRLECVRLNHARLLLITDIVSSMRLVSRLLSCRSMY